MSVYSSVIEATRIALRESTFDAEPLSAMRFVRTLDRDAQSEARAAVNFVYQNGRAPRSVQVAARMLEAS